MVTAPHALAAQTGLTTMIEGGNAADAAIAMAASLAVLYPHMTGIGGDVFFLYYEAASRTLHAYNGSGAAAQLATVAYYRDRALHRVPERGGLAALTVPGALDAWFAIHERFGSLAIAKILAPAIAFAHDGAPAARSFVEAVHRLREILAVDAAAADLYLNYGPKAVGDRFANPRLGDTLAAIAQHGRGWFYEGDGAVYLERRCKETGSPLRASDLANHRGYFTSPALGTCFGFTAATLPPNSQGIAAIIAEQTYERYADGSSDDLRDGSAARTHAGIEAIRLAFVDRDAHVADPRVIPPWDHLLAIAHADGLAQRIDPDQSLPGADTASDAGDTTYFACVDRAGNAASFIQSLFHSFGSGVVVPELGIALQNRGIAFELTEHRLRSLMPGALPFHTLMPCMLMRDGAPWLVHGSMGGEGQAQTALQLATRIAHDRIDPQTAIEAPRWRFGAQSDGDPQRVFLESRFDRACLAGLEARGHLVTMLSDFDESMGHAGAIQIDGETGTLVGGADPRGDGAALGW